MLKRRLLSGKRAQLGMTIVELMVGVTIGLIIVAAASLLMTNQLFENRRLLTEAQMQQDLRAAADIATRQVRRAGINGEIHVLNSVWYPGAAQVVPGILMLPGSTDSLAVPSAAAVTFNYFPGSTAVPGPFGFELLNDVLRTSLFHGANQQDLTDGNVMRVTAFTPTLTTDSSANIVLPCPKPCSDGTSACWPKFQVRKLRLDIEAEARSASGVKRAMSSTVRVRNDNVVFSSEALPNQMCP